MSSNARQIEGIATCLAAVAAFFVLPDFPMNTRWLSEEEKMLSLQRLQADNLGGGGGNMPEDIGHLRSLKAAFTDWRTYVSIPQADRRARDDALGVHLPLHDVHRGFDHHLFHTHVGRVARLHGKCDPVYDSSDL
jgi:hypothetical protein